MIERHPELADEADRAVDMLTASLPPTPPQETVDAMMASAHAVRKAARGELDTFLNNPSGEQSFKDKGPNAERRKAALKLAAARLTLRKLASKFGPAEVQKLDERRKLKVCHRAKMMAKKQQQQQHLAAKHHDEDHEKAGHGHHHHRRHGRHHQHHHGDRHIHAGGACQTTEGPDPPGHPHQQHLVMHAGGHVEGGAGSGSGSGSGPCITPLTRMRGRGRGSGFWGTRGDNDNNGSAGGMRMFSRGPSVHYRMCGGDGGGGVGGSGGPRNGVAVC